VLCAVQNETGGGAACLGVACVLCAVQNETVVVWQHVLGVACVLCAVQNETEVVWQHVLEWRVCCVLCRMRPSQVGAIFV
jgi:hypothetical protein